MQRAWLSLLGVLGLVVNCLGYAMNRSEPGVLGPGIWPGSHFHTDRRAAIKSFFNEKIHGADIDNILRDTEAKKSVKEEEKCSSCSDDPLRVRRSNDIPNIESGLKINNQNASKLKESPISSTSAMEPKTPEPISKQKTSNTTSERKTSDAMSESKSSNVIPKIEIADATSESKNSNVIPKVEIADVTSESKSSDVIPKVEIADSTSESKSSDVIPKIEIADATSGLKTSDMILKTEIADVTSGLTNSDVPSELTVSTESKPSHVTTESKASHMTSELKSSHVTSKSKASHVALESKLSDVTLQPKNSNIRSEKNPGSEVIRNVVLLLIDHNGPDQEANWKKFGAAYEFPIQGYLQNCRRSESSENFKFSLDESLVSRRRDECECDRLLRANVGSLLAWARHVKDMTTGAVSATNFSIPSPLGYEKLPSQVAKDLENEVNSPKQDDRRTHTDLKTNWRLVEQKQSSLFSSTPRVVAESATKVDGLNGFDGIWDVFDMFSRIRMAFFRILMESLGNLTGSEDEFSGRRPFSVQPNVVDLVSDTVRELKSLPNKNGFMMVVAAPGNEISAIVEALQREVSPDNTLLVVAGMCSANNELVPFSANGPGGKSLQEGLPIWELPFSIRSAISNGCHSHVCKNKLPDDPLVLPSLELSSFPNDVPHKRIARAKEEVETTSTTGDDKTTKVSENVKNNSNEKTTVPEMEKRSGAAISRVDYVASILGIATSITAMLALNS